MGRWPTINPPLRGRSRRATDLRHRRSRRGGSGDAARRARARRRPHPARRRGVRQREAPARGPAGDRRSTAIACIRRRRRPSPSCARGRGGRDRSQVHRLVSLDRGAGRPQAAQAEPVGDARQERPRLGIRGRPQPRTPPKPFGQTVPEWLKTNAPESAGTSAGRRTSRGTGCTAVSAAPLPRGRRPAVAERRTAAPAARPAGSSTSTSCVACSGSMTGGEQAAVVAAVVRSNARTSSPTTASSDRARRRRCSARPPG